MVCSLFCVKRECAFERVFAMSECGSVDAMCKWSGMTVKVRVLGKEKRKKGR